ncbi:unnamed protein product [Euphydryas editha]|uniref:U4/U6.U5 tri-snRNP-associated protein 1 n=1 Tax=Euphydryas editha TaxID=104508 RepID=A0AAU9VDI2_EUPED|nr:unnamed protein product [Euphydryas editha]
MGSKKHKKESKKRKHRSRSRSPVDGEERERKRHKKHKDRKRDRSPDVEEVPVDSHLVADNGVRSRSRSSSLSLREPRESRPKDNGRDNSQESERDASPVAATSSAQESLSIEETNKLRAKLGLKPLEVAEKPADDGKIKDDLGEFYHKPAANLSQQRAADKLRERLELRRERRKLESRLAAAPLGADDDDDDALGWVQRSRDLERQKQEAAKRAALLDELDAEFGVGALLADEQRDSRQRAYAHAQLRGLRVAHDLAALPEEHETVLTLADKDVLAEDSEDVLVNVNIVDDEKYKKNIEERKKALAGYRAYDEEQEVAAALGLGRSVLAKYDDEIDKDAAQRRRGFRLGDDAALEAERARQAMRAERLAGGPDKRLESLQLPELRIASDYLDEQEIQTKFKKTKRKNPELLSSKFNYALQVNPELDFVFYVDRKDPNTLTDIQGSVLETRRYKKRVLAVNTQACVFARLHWTRPRLPHSRLAPWMSRFQTEVETPLFHIRLRDVGPTSIKGITRTVIRIAKNIAVLQRIVDIEVKPEQLVAMEDEDEGEVDTELQAALARARRLRLAERESNTPRVPKVEEILQQAKEEPPEVESSDPSTMVLDATAEFCRTLGDIPTYGLAGNRDHFAEIMDFERDEVEAEPEVDSAAGAWSRVDVHSERPPDIAAGACATGALPRHSYCWGISSRTPSFSYGSATSLRAPCRSAVLRVMLDVLATLCISFNIVCHNYSNEANSNTCHNDGLMSLNMSEKVDHLFSKVRCAAVGLEAEPALGAGVAGALRLALSKGYLERAGAAPAPRPRAAAALTAHHYSIEDKTYGEDDKHGRRERGHAGPLSEFREKTNFRPHIKLEYVDDDGRPLCPKEAFRYLSHKFHGKGPGKNKQEKRIKKAVQEGLMKKMSSTDTPLGTLQMLQQKQRETQSPFVVLSGAKRDANN